jgi:predicted nucleic acid-binding protein
MIVIADTSAINYLILIGEVDLLRQMYGQIVLPPAVLAELLAADSPPVVARWITDPPNWVAFADSVAAGIAEVDDSLDAGEREAIALALRLSADLLLIDDAQGRREASRLRIEYTGTLGMLAAASKRGLVNIEDAMRRLKATGFFMSEAVVRKVLADAR